MLKIKNKMEKYHTNTQTSGYSKQYYDIIVRDLDNANGKCCPYTALIYWFVEFHRTDPKTFSQYFDMLFRLQLFELTKPEFVCI